MKPGTVLVVDDDPNVRQALRRALSPHIAAVLLAEDAEAAKTLLSQHRVNVAIIDEKMPGRSGLDLLSDIRTDYPNTRCIMLTGWAPHHKVAHALKEKKICAFFRKPWDDDEILACIEGLIDAATAQEVIDSQM
ncbi:MAG: response regulator [Candidatus Lindowbacteria bacterium]|nr:response regulator [Candidatus Lindowbacteria bacterium]